jgi:hypothetical protein
MMRAAGVLLLATFVGNAPQSCREVVRALWVGCCFGFGIGGCGLDVVGLDL